MPELPEVETVRQGIEPLVGVPIERVRVARRDVVRGLDGERRGGIETASLLAGGAIARTRRHGKQLALIGTSGACVLVHLGMSGQLLVLDHGGRVRGGHAHVSWTARGGRRLVFRDPRRFGGVWLLPDENALDARWATLGPDAMSVTGVILATSLARSRRAVKAGLLDQGSIAGVGNIYADEALFDAGIDPRRSCDSLAGDDWERLAGSLVRVLNDGLRLGGATLRDYRRPDGSVGRGTRGHRVYGRANQDCVRCGQELAQAQVAQRTTVWCPRCQHAVSG
ncbi:MAG: bifunctional DNA-formamidopyrimidine glycosylase/DNA-(apurinic or apyrimidinic site) lyase [Planctomycetota bacterium]